MNIAKENSDTQSVEMSGSLDDLKRSQDRWICSNTQIQSSLGNTRVVSILGLNHCNAARRRVESSLFEEEIPRIELAYYTPSPWAKIRSSSVEHWSSELLGFEETASRNRTRSSRCEQISKLERQIWPSASPVTLRRGSASGLLGGRMFVTHVGAKQGSRDSPA